jgi:hypothetical protein
MLANNVFAAIQFLGSYIDLERIETGEGLVLLDHKANPASRDRWSVVRPRRRLHPRYRLFGHRNLDRPAVFDWGDTDRLGAFLESSRARNVVGEMNDQDE